MIWNSQLISIYFGTTKYSKQSCIIKKIKKNNAEGHLTQDMVCIVQTSKASVPHDSSLSVVN